MSDTNELKEIPDFPLIALRGVVMFPTGVMSFEIGRQKSIEALEKSISNENYIFAVSQKDPSLAEPTIKDINTRGTLVRIIQIVKQVNGTRKVIVEGDCRADISNYTQTEPYFRVAVNRVKEEEAGEGPEMEAMMRIAKDAFEKYAKATSRIVPEGIMKVLSADKFSTLSDIIAVHSLFAFKVRQDLLETDDPLARLAKTIKILYSELEVMEIKSRISEKVKTSVDKNQKDYYLKEQLKAINQELGNDEAVISEADAYRERMLGRDFPEKVAEKLEKEIGRLTKISASSAESTVSRDYIECLLDLPWDKSDKESFNLKKCEKTLETEHYGLEKVKERIIEFLAVKQKAAKLDAPVLCLAGPPGVGKTSIAKSMAKALGRKYVRISLGGVRDEAEIRGHRKTYVGSMPGRIIQALKQAGTNNPLLLLDEIDKMNADFRGDPASALLEVLDNEQNVFFRDHYVELEFDLSNVLFVCTANSTEKMQRALIDRLEIIQLSSYTKEEKFHIAKDYLLPRQIKKHGLKMNELNISGAALEAVIKGHTKEAGVRQLERAIGKICRKSVKKLMTEKKKALDITEDNLEDFLGKQKYKEKTLAESPEIGLVNGLAYTSVGGTVLAVEVNTMPGLGKLELTGSMGDVMKESARAAMSYIRSNSENFGLEAHFYKKMDIHIHIPEGAVPKDGPSAGITMATAMLSAILKEEVRSDIAMTGEVTIRGRVLPIGGLKEKILAAKEMGLKEIIVPADNLSDIDELEDYVKEGLVFHYVKEMSDVLNIALIRRKT